MSALPPKADMFSVKIDVCFVPIADTKRATFCPGAVVLTPLAWRWDHGLLRLHLERKHLRRTTPESRRYGNSIR